MTTGVPTTLGRRVAELRERLGWTQRVLADKARLSVTFLSEVENGRRMPGTDSLLQLAEALGTSLDYIVKGAAPALPAPRQPLVVPPELAEAAEDGHWPAHALTDLLRFRQMVIARRGRGTHVDEPDRALSANDWRDLYRAYERLLNPSDGDPAHP
jgi:transcriptional regulator with XRE-family HTH domain